MTKILITADLDKKRILSKFQDSFDIEFAGYADNYVMLSPEELQQKCESIDILISEFDTIDEKVFNVAKKLKLIICCRGGVSTVVDLSCAKKHGVVVCNNIGRNQVACAEMTITFLLDLLRHVSQTNQLIHNRVLTPQKSDMPKEYRDSLWGLDKSSPYVTYRSQRRRDITLGLIGYGHVGKTVAKFAKDLDINVIATSPSLLSNRPETCDVEIVELDELLKRSDFVSLHASGNPDRKPIMTGREFSLMKKTAYFINTARGYLIDENALISALENGDISGAALDVVNQEPILPDNPLLNTPNLILTPHIGGSSYDTIIRGTDMVIEALDDWISGKPLRHNVLSNV